MELNKSTVIIADDHGVVRLGLKKALEESGEFSVLAESADADETLKFVRELKPTLLILDIGLPVKSGVEVLFTIQREKLPTKVVVFTRHDDQFMVKQSISGGAVAYLLKDTPMEDVVRDLRLVLSGERVFPNRYQQLLTAQPSPAEDLANAGQQDPLVKLSKREREIFFFIAEGLPNRVIAKKLFISPRTVETHRARIIKKLEVKSTADLIHFAIKNNLVSPKAVG